MVCLAIALAPSCPSLHFWCLYSMLSKSYLPRIGDWKAVIFLYKSSYTFISSWWFQPIWKILVNLDHSPNRDENNKYVKPPANICTVHTGCSANKTCSISIRLSESYSVQPAESSWLLGLQSLQIDALSNELLETNLWYVITYHLITYTYYTYINIYSMFWFYYM